MTNRTHTISLCLMAAVALFAIARLGSGMDHADCSAPVAAAPAPRIPENLSPEPEGCGSDEDCYNACLDWYSDDGLGEATDEVATYCADPFGKAEPGTALALRKDI